MRNNYTLFFKRNAEIEQASYIMWSPPKFKSNLSEAHQNSTQIYVGSTKFNPFYCDPPKINPIYKEPTKTQLPV